MNKLLIKSMFIICIAVLLAMGSVVAYALSEGMDLANPEEFPSPPNNKYGTYEPSITADGKTIYFAQFGAGIGHPDNINRDMFVSYKRDNGRWTKPERLPSPPNSNDWSLGEARMLDTEPMISADGRTLIFQSNRPGGQGNSDIWVSRIDSQTNEWGEPENFGSPINTIYKDHCLILRTTKDGEVGYWASKRPDGFEGIENYGGGDIYASIRSINGGWSTPWNLGPDVNTAGGQCRFVPGLGNLIGIVTDHDSAHHQEYLVQYNTTTEEWVGPRVFADWNYGPEGSGASDGCGNFTTDGERWIWSSGRNLGADYNFPDVLDLYWVYTEAILKSYDGNWLE